jgi:hypothetical protein
MGSLRLNIQIGASATKTSIADVAPITRHVPSAWRATILRTHESLRYLSYVKSPRVLPTYTEDRIVLLLFFHGSTDTIAFVVLMA